MPDRDDLTPLDDSTNTAFPPDRAPERIGPYKVLEKIGEGGMGVVYLAEQAAPLRRRVALKVIKPGMDSKQVLARFEAERQALALMNHPGVAKVFDAGSTAEGRPYFVMEHVAGLPITEYCDKHLLDNRQRLELFIQVCEAIQHAHQKGIIHRDIKPSNVLVALLDGKPQPKVIDFGVAKATQQHLTEQTLFTQQGVLIGTPEYMSPEQAEMSALDIDTRSDVYSLGVLLYELLTGLLPLDAKALRRAAFHEMQRIIRETDPAKPSARISTLGVGAADVAARRHTDVRTLQKQLRGDLDWISLKALEKDRSRRYDSASEFARDIGRCLSDLPVSAGPPTTAYRLAKLIRRNRGKVAATFLVGVVLAASTVAISVLYIRANRERKEARYNSYVANLAAANAALTSGNGPEASRRLALCPAELRGWEWRHLISASNSSLSMFKVSEGEPVVAAFGSGGRGIRVITDSPSGLESWELGPSSERSQRVLRRLSGRPIALSGDRFLVRDHDKVRAFQADDEHELAAIEAPMPNSFIELSVAMASSGAPWVAFAGPQNCQLWNYATGFKKMLPCRYGFARPTSFGAIALDFAGSRIVYQGFGGPLAIFDIETGRESALRTAEFRGGPFAFSPDGRRIAMGGGGGALSVVDLATGRETTRRDGTASTMALAFSPNGRLIVSASDDRILRLWDTTYLNWDEMGLNLRARLMGHSGEIRSVSFDPAGAHIVTASRGGEVGYWDATSNPAGESLQLPDLSSGDLRWSDGHLRTTAVSRSSKRLQAWDLDTANPIRDLAGWDDLRGVRLSPTGRRAVYFGRDGIARVVDLRDGTSVQISAEVGTVSEATFTSTGDRVVVGTTEGGVAICDATSGSVIVRSSSDPKNRVHELSVSVDDRYVAVVAMGVVAVSRMSDLKEQFRFGGNDGREFSTCSFAPAEAQLACAARSPEVRLVSATSGALVRTFLGQSEAISQLAWSPDGKRLAAGTSAGRVRIWDSSSGESLLELSTPNHQQIQALAFDPNGSELAAKDFLGITRWRAGSRPNGKPH